MRKFDEGAKGIFYFPEQYVNIFTGTPIKAIAENPQGYSDGDMVRVVYGIDDDGNTIPNVDVFEAFSPLVNGRAVFYLPIPEKLMRVYNSPTGGVGSSSWRISFKTKHSWDYNVRTNSLTHRYLILSAQRDGTKRSESIPVYWYSEKGEGLFGYDKLNKQGGSTTDFSVMFRSKPYFYDGFASFLMSGQMFNEGVHRLSTNELARVINSTDNIERFACKISDFQNKKLLIWTQPDAYGLRSFWFNVSEVNVSREKLGTETYEVEALDSTNAPDYIEKERSLYFPKKRIKLNSGKWKPHVIEMLKSIMQAPRVWLYNPYPNFKTENGVISQIVKLDNNANGTGRGEWELSNGLYISEVIEELIYHPLNEFQVKVDCHVSTGPGLQGYLGADFRQNENEAWSQIAQYSISGFSTNIQIDRSKKVAPQFRLRPQGNPTFTIKNFYIYGNIGAYEDAKIQESSLTITKHNSELSEIELTLELDEFKKPDYLII